MTYRTSRIRAGVAALSLTVLTVTAPQVSAAEDWSLQGREGDCYPIQVLKDRLADLPDVHDPDAFQQYLESKGWQFTRKTHAVKRGKAVEFSVEAPELSILWVTRERCAPIVSPNG